MATSKTSSAKLKEPIAQAAPLAEGAPAPAFTYLTADGASHSTADFAGRPYVVYFYPKDDTPGCTKQACSFRDRYADFREAGVAVIGVSVDSDASHARFRNKYDLPFGLAADPEKRIVTAFGVWGEKKFMGRAYAGTHRITFLVGADGRIAKVWPKVKPENHAAEVLAAAVG